MKILVLTSRFPYPVIGGDKLRIYKICQRLADDFDLSLLSLCSTKEEMDYQVDDHVFSEINRVYLPNWKSYLNTSKAFFSKKPLQLAYYYSSKFENLVNKKVKDHDLVLAHLLRTAQYLKGINKIPKVLEMTDAISLNYERIANIKQKSLKQRIFEFEQPRILNEELEAFNNFDLTSLVSDVDRNYLIKEASISNENKIKVYSNGVDFDTYDFVEPSKSNEIAFLGNMTAAHNFDACKYFIKEILPEIREEKNEISLKIVGIANNKELDYFSDFKNVNATGKVEDVTKELKSCFCGIAPLRHGAGLQNKILEYMAVGLPVVTNRIGAEGTKAINRKEIVIAKNNKKFKNAILKLYRDKDFRNKISKNGRNYVRSNHNWDLILDKYKSDIASLL